jgi:hypothetical protein
MMGAGLDADATPDHGDLGVAWIAGLRARESALTVVPEPTSLFAACSSSRKLALVPRLLAELVEKLGTLMQL